VKEAAVTTQLLIFFSQFKKVSFKAGEVLFPAGTQVTSILYLESGVIKQSSTSAKGKEVVITHYKTGSFFPLIWALHLKPIPFDLIAVTEGYGWKAPATEVISFLKQNAEVTFDLMVRLLSGLEGMSHKVESALQATAAQRVAQALVMLASRFGDDEGEVYKDKRNIKMSLTHQELANLTGLSRETVSRELKFLKDEGLLSLKNDRFTILKFEDLTIQ